MRHFSSLRNIYKQNVDQNKQDVGSKVNGLGLNIAASLFPSESIE